MSGSSTALGPLFTRYGNVLDLMFAWGCLLDALDPMLGDAFWTTLLRPWAVFEPGLMPVLQSFSQINM